MCVCNLDLQLCSESAKESRLMFLQTQSQCFVQHLLFAFEFQLSFDLFLFTDSQRHRQIGIQIATKRWRCRYSWWCRRCKLLQSCCCCCGIVMQLIAGNVVHKTDAIVRTMGSSSSAAIAGCRHCTVR